MPDLLDDLTDNLNGVGPVGDGLELPEEPEAAGKVGKFVKPAAALAGAKSLLSDSGDEGKAVGEVEGRRMVVEQPESSGMEGIVNAIAGIALLGLPVKAVTAAVGSKL